MNETAINSLAFIGAIGSAVWFVQSLKTLMARSQPEPESVTPSSQPAPDPTANDAAVIAAAIYAVLESGRIVHIENDNGNKHWAAEGRWMHQTSHCPH
ncbi:hypothetical protein [Telmatospirillum siberiense]|uniref:hypothetical protein n=1 Tax=Telmatospirillum siberiense TaxID=382514 RepID=UPI0011AF2868|nr:hypothetical protein [Telmatospirillum siberiense]